MARRGRIAYLESQGVMDLESKKPMQNDTIFRLASMTKPVTSIAVMMLHEEGRFLLDDPVSKFLPEFRNPKVAIANAPNERALEGYRLVPAEREITIRHLLAHSAGLASVERQRDARIGEEAERRAQARRRCWRITFDNWPRFRLNFQPGTAWGIWAGDGRPGAIGGGGFRSAAR